MLFVDGMGHPAQAEDLDVWVEPSTDSGSGKGFLESVGGAVKDLGARIMEGVEDGVNAVERATGWDIDQDGDIGVKGHANGAEQTKAGELVGSPPQGDGHAMAKGAARTARTPGQSGGGGYGTTARPRTSRSPRKWAGGAGAQGVPGYTPLDAPTRQRHLQLWASRQQADKLLAKVKAAKAEAGAAGASKKGMEPRAPTSFAHEMNMNREGFAFGGLDPGTLHAHGKLVKVHAVHYSIGLAGRYKLHVGLRQQMQPLPGSPFQLLVEPGSAYAASSRLPAESLPLSGVASEELQHGLTFQTSDMLGNLCVHGGADISVKLGKMGNDRDSKEADSVELNVVDNGDGSYQLKWKCARAGTYPVDVLISGAHVGGSPTELHVGSAEPAVEQMTVSGLGMSKAIAGIDAALHISVADRFGNRFEPGGSQSFPYSFGLILNPNVGSTGAMDKADKKKQAKIQEKDPGAGGRLRVEDEKKAASLPFEGRWNGLAYEISYVAKEAGPMDLHVWAATRKETPQRTDSKDTKDDAAKSEMAAAAAAAASTTSEQRVPLPGSPFTVHVSEGNASAVGSSVGEAEAGKQGVGFVAGENVIMRPQVRDSFGNASNPPEGALSAEQIMPITAGHVDTYVELAPPKLKGGLGSYEVVVEPTRAGVHNVHIK